MRYTRIVSLLVGCALALPICATQAQGAEIHAGPHYFSFVAVSAVPKIDPNEFIVEVTDPAIVEEYKSMIANQILQPRIAFVAKVAKGRVDYNEAWNFHVVPESLTIAGSGSTEVCDTSPNYIEDDIDAVGGAGGFLPNSDWCPWSFHISREVLR